MKIRKYGLYALALGLVAVGALWAGVPVGSVALFGLLLACPLMMLFMMRGMHGTDTSGAKEHGPAAPHDHSAMR